ncbi:hypothetical protein Q1695_009544 [Nippostrongylus brasiliensis]|nr:hypothetical protein Q1695_009544 [Nippostrongylus brasiliensis]
MQLFRFAALLILVAVSTSFPFSARFPRSQEVVSTTPVVIHHRHKNHHISHNHRRRSLASKEEAKARSKHMLLTKPYWPWP